MTQEEIIKGNKIIAEFMGAKMIVTDYHGINIIKFPNGDTKDLYGLKYHCSWDWLMPVVEKIEAEGFTVTIFSTSCNIKRNFAENNVCETFIVANKITATWLAVIEFLEWYDKQNK